MSDLEDRIAALEAEVGKLRDQLAIQRIISRYGPLVDSATTEERLRKVAEYFGEEGVYDIADNAQYSGREFAEKSLKGPNHQGYLKDGSTHLMAMPYVVVAGDRATALGYSHVMTNRHDGEFKVARGSVNYWEFVREDGEWRILRRTNRLVDGTETPRKIMRRVDETAPDEKAP